MLENGNEKVNNKMDEVSQRILRVLGGRYNNLKGLFLNYLKTK